MLSLVSVMGKLVTTLHLPPRRPSPRLHRNTSATSTPLPVNVLPLTPPYHRGILSLTM